MRKRKMKRFLLTIESHKRIWRQMKNVLIGWNVILSLSHTHLLLNSSNDTFKTAAAENLTKIYHDF